MVIVGNKTDIPPAQRQVKGAEGEALAKEFKCAWIECSARTAENLQKSFELVIGEIEKQNDPNEPPGGGKCVIM
jgi:Ras homolog enriched in brain